MFRPLNDDHAIESVKFALLLTRPITPKAIFEIERQHSLWQDEMPAKRIIDIDVDVNGRATKAPGIMFAFLRPDATPMWSMQIGSSQIEIECYIYSRWDRTWGIAREHFQNAIRILASAQEKLMVSAVNLMVKDAFLSDAKSYSITNLLKSSDKLPQSVLDAIGPWNTYFSWMIEENKDVRTLHAFDVDVSWQGDEARVEITHVQTRNTGVDLALADILDDDFQALGSIMEALHRSNKLLLSELIVGDMSERIGLGESNGKL